MIPFPLFSYERQLREFKPASTVTNTVMPLSAMSFQNQSNKSENHIQITFFCTPQVTKFSQPQLGNSAQTTKLNQCTHSSEPSGSADQLSLVPYHRSVNQQQNFPYTTSQFMNQ